MFQKKEGEGGRTVVIPKKDSAGLYRDDRSYRVLGKSFGYPDLPQNIFHKVLITRASQRFKVSRSRKRNVED